MAPTAAITRCAGILALVSILLIVEGVSRINLFIGTPGGKWRGDHSTYPPVVELIAAVGLTFSSAPHLASLVSYIAKCAHHAVYQDVSRYNCKKRIRVQLFLDFCASFCVEVENCSEYMLARRLTRPSQRPDSAPAWQRGSSGDICAPDHRGRAWMVLLQRVRTVQLSLHGGKSCWADARPHRHPVKCSHNDGERSRSVWNLVWLPSLHISKLASRPVPCASWDSGPDKPVTLASKGTCELFSA